MQFFVVKVDKKMQQQKRNNLVSKQIGYLGIKHSEQEDDDKIEGVRIWDTEKDSPAYNAALKPNDIIKSINGKKVLSYTELSEQISLYGPGTVIEIAYINSFSINNEITVKEIKLGERTFEIVLPPHTIDFQYNLQIGEIISIGTIAGKEFPDALVGDILIFHHAVEHKPRTEGDTLYNDFHLIDTDPEGNEYRIVNYATELFGVLKLADAVIVPYKKFIFCHKSIAKSSMQKNKNGIWLPDAWEVTIEQQQEQIDELTAEITEIMSSSVMNEQRTEQNYKKKEEIEKRVREVMAERAAISRKMNQKKLVELTVVFINPLTSEEVGTDINAGDKLLAEYNTLYPLDIYGQQYTLLRKDYIEALIAN